jgi:hypothetical protein
MGSRSRLCLWVDNLWGIQIPSEEQMITHYASRLYQRRASSLRPATTIDLGPAHPYRAAVMAVENGQYVATIAGSKSPPRDSDQFDQLLRNLLPERVAAAVARGRPAGPVIMSASARVRRYFDSAERFPPNVFAIGDSLCSSDPLEGRGFEAALVETRRLVRTWLSYSSTTF